MTREIAIKRVYEPAAKSDGTRILVDRLWPRGVSRAGAALDVWMKDVAPSAELRKWFNHEPERWAEFRRRYEAELKKNRAAVELLLAHGGKKRLTLLYSAHDEERNQAVVLAAHLRKLN
ncbi:MAG: DUF488 domain-containing protein [Parvibaculum sp.]|uniref:DUF488 domain-containing protein n=1 Tax=Parvibaculum sp. TaxID=2024848 RepID=UPI00284AE392|nr:DUF488 domain-containing protein [Parvibaculum sp.]MDR3499837.1 DUF488 domain-containing protein [Parvibaculum sp.]